jgi:hypothetical protein
MCIHYNLLESYLTKYEAYLTNTPLCNWNQNLPHIAIATQIITALFLMVTAISIKLFFKLKTKQPKKPRIKNTISFKRLNIIYSLGLISSATLHAVLMKNQSTDTYIMHYTVSLVINSMLFSLILTDNEARSFFKLKFLSWKEENMFNLQKINVFKTKFRIGPIAGKDWKANTYKSEDDNFANGFGGIGGDDVEEYPESNTQVVLESDDIFVIDMEHLRLS